MFSDGYLYLSTMFHSGFRKSLRGRYCSGSRGDNMKSIAIFDSGIGGITFLREARHALPEENFIYFADTDNVPYGIKPEEDVRRYVGNAVAFLSRMGIKALVIACNAATSAAVAELRQQYDFPILGMEPAIKPALAYAAQKKVLVFSTSLTARGNKLRMLIARLEREHQVHTLPLDELVRTAEAFDFTSLHVREIIRKKLASLDLSCYGAVVLGCTHFIFYRQMIEQELPPGVRVFDGNEGTLRNLVNTLGSPDHGSSNAGGAIRFYSSCRKDSVERQRILLQLVRE